MFSTVIMAVCSLFNRMLLLTDLIPVHLLYCGQTVMIGCNHTSFEWTRAVRHIYGIIRHMQGLYWSTIGLYEWISTDYIELQCGSRLEFYHTLKGVLHPDQFFLTVYAFLSRLNLVQKETMWSLILYVVRTVLRSMYVVFCKIDHCIHITYIDVFPWDLDTMNLG